MQAPAAGTESSKLSHLACSNLSHTTNTHLHKRTCFLTDQLVFVAQDVKCPGCVNISTVFSHAQTVVLCGSCSQVLCQPTGGKARLTEGESSVCVMFALYVSVCGVLNTPLIPPSPLFSPASRTPMDPFLALNHPCLSFYPHLQAAPSARRR